MTLPVGDRGFRRRDDGHDGGGGRDGGKERCKLVAVSRYLSCLVGARGPSDWVERPIETLRAKEKRVRVQESGAQEGDERPHDECRRRRPK